MRQLTVANANIQTDISCPDGSSYTLAVPLTKSQAYSVPANGSSFILDDFPALSHSWVPSAQLNSPLVYQGTAPATVCSGGLARKAYFVAFGIQDGSSGDPAGPGIISTDSDDPLNVRFHCADVENKLRRPLESDDSSKSQPSQLTVRRVCVGR